ncbi:MAG: conjugal transfer protein TraH [Alphaproteobacteria bacterium]|jgi:conjugative transfer pilus assembly protein TraH|nr:conjugal transfer protein TraH [Alphaproteobacteria bacterium]MBT5389484.1 conjugal transfer protein TraH [Alphaproteobacteria bacterium]MBT5654594.1 conjugal transfer protein TraH [Alphaproteobacteria bacterium]
MRKFLLLLLFSTLISSSSSADVTGDLSNFFNKLGSSSNISRAGAYEDQTAGYYTGGNLFLRNQIHTSQLGTIQLPDYKAGCGGIDMFMGAFSHLSSERLLEALKSIGSNMASYALLLAIETMSPQVKNIMTELNDLVQKINQSNINSCEIAATTLGSVWPKSNEAQGHLCKMIGTEGKYGGFSDYAAARQGCGASGKRDSVIGSASEDPRFKSMLGVDFNLAWKAIQENAFLQSDKKLAEFFMSVSGTIISKNHTLQTKVSLADKDSFLSALLHGGEVRVYTCVDADKCLDLRERVMSIEHDESLLEKVRKILLSIQNKIYEDEALSLPEIAFLNSTRLPFYKIINVSTAYRRGASPVDIMDYAELGAIDIIFQYLSEIIDVINESTDHIRLVQVDDVQLNRFQKSLNEARKRIIDRRTGSFQEIEKIISIVRKTELLEKNIMSQVGALSEEGI